MTEPTPEEPDGPEPKRPSALNPLSILRDARKAVPSVDYALGIAGVAAAAAIVIALLGSRVSTIVTIALILIGMVLLFAFSRLVASQSPWVAAAGLVLLWVVVLVFSSGIVLTGTAIAFGFPERISKLLTSDAPVCLPPNEQIPPASCGGADSASVVVDVQANDPDHGLNVRAQPDLNSVVLGVLHPNTTDISVDKCVSDWCPIECTSRNLRGFSRNRYLSLRSQTLFSVTGVPQNDPKALVVRNGPDNKCGAVASIPASGTGVIVHVCEYGTVLTSGWCLVTYGHSRGKVVSGWVAAGNLVRQANP